MKMEQDTEQIEMVEDSTQGNTAKSGYAMSPICVDSPSSSNSTPEFQHPASATTSRTASLCSEGDKTEKVLKTLQFRNPGPQYSGFNPDRSRREQRKVNQFVEKTKGQKNGGTKRRRRPAKTQCHDRSGVRLSDGKDVCDCQDLNCPGCHFPCASCGSEKCGIECRCSRKWTYTDVEIENPFRSSKMLWVSS